MATFRRNVLPLSSGLQIHIAVKPLNLTNIKTVVLFYFSVRRRLRVYGVKFQSFQNLALDKGKYLASLSGRINPFERAKVEWAPEPVWTG
jgi:hypothetical protein